MPERRTQDLGDLKAKLSSVDADSLDDFAVRVAAFLEQFPGLETYTSADLGRLLTQDFDAAKTVFRLFLGLSQDEFTQALKANGAGSAGVKAYGRDPALLLDALDNLGVPAVITAMTHKPVRWQDILLARLEGGRGRAVKGQRRGRALENFVEAIVADVFGQGGYEARKSFTCVDGSHTEKCDFAIPNAKAPHVIIESKAYGATGSKQTDVIGDIEKIVGCKRADVTFLLVTDGLTWSARQSDLRKIIAFQNRGQIYRIYTMAMAEDLRSDLLEIKAEKKL